MCRKIKLREASNSEKQVKYVSFISFNGRMEINLKILFLFIANDAKEISVLLFSIQLITCCHVSNLISIPTKQKPTSLSPFLELRGSKLIPSEHLYHVQENPCNAANLDVSLDDKPFEFLLEVFVVTHSHHVVATSVWPIVNKEVPHFNEGFLTMFPLNHADDFLQIIDHKNESPS